MLVMAAPWRDTCPTTGTESCLWRSGCRNSFSRDAAANTPSTASRGTDQSTDQRGSGVDRTGTAQHGDHCDNTPGATRKSHPCRAASGGKFNAIERHFTFRRRSIHQHDRRFVRHPGAHQSCGRATVQHRRLRACRDFSGARPAYRAANGFRHTARKP